MKFKRLIALLSLTTLLLAGCEDESEWPINDSFDVDNYSFSNISIPDIYSYDDVIDKSEPTHSYTPIETPDPIDPTNINEYDEPTYPSQTITYPEILAPTDPNSGSINYDVAPSNVKYAVTDMSRIKKNSEITIVEDLAYYNNLAINLAENEIDHMGFDTFRAIATIYDPAIEGEDKFIYVAGIAFTEGAIYDVVDGEVIYSCGFMQIKQEGEDVPILSDKDGDKRYNVANGIMVFPNDEEDTRKFIIESNTIVEGFSGVSNNFYFSYKQESTFVISVNAFRIEGELEDVADLELDIYDFDNEEYLYKASIFHTQKDLSAFGIYGERGAKAYEDALNILEEAIKIQEEKGIKLALNNIVIVSDDLLTSLSLQEQRESVNGMITNYINKLELKENEYLMIDENGNYKVGVDYNYQALREQRIASGLLKTIASLGAMKMGISVIVTVLSGGAAAPFLGVLMLAGGIGTSLYSLSNLSEGFTELYAGATGLDEYDTTKANFFRNYCIVKMDGDEEAGTKLFHTIGLISTISTAILGPLNMDLNASGIIRGGLDIGHTIIQISHYVGRTIIRYTITAGAAYGAAKITQYVGNKMGLSYLQTTLLSYGTGALAGFLAYKGVGAYYRAKNSLNGKHFGDVRYVTKKEIAETGYYDEQVSTQKVVTRRIRTNDIDIIDGTGENYSEMTMSYKNGYANRIIRNSYYEQGIKTHVTLKTYTPYESFEFGPMMAKNLSDIDNSSSTYEPIAGYYDPNNHTIYLDIEVLKNDGVRTLRTLAHLMRHVYQFENAEFNSPIMHALREENYVAYDENLYEYLNNPAEIDANAYADYIVERAYTAYNAKLADKSLIEFISEIEYPDPITFKEAR